MKKIILLILFVVNIIHIEAQVKHNTFWDGNLQKPRVEGYYQNGEKTGQWASYYENGKIHYTGNYIQGKKNGVWKYYYQNGQLDIFTHYANGTAVGERKDYHPNGKLRYIIKRNTKGIAIGESKTYDIKGNLLFTVTYKEGELYKTKYENNKLEKYSTYREEEEKKQEIENNLGNSIKIKLIQKTKTDTNYSYVFGTKEQTYNHKKVNVLTILLLKNKKVVSEISYNSPFEYMTVTEINRIEGYNLDNINETIEMGFGRAACGYGIHSVLFFRKGESLIKGILISSYGEAESEYSYSEIIGPIKKRKNQIWVKTVVGYSKREKDEIVDVNYYTETEKYKFQKNKLVLLNPKKKNNYYYVTAKSGLRQRYQPFITGGKLSLLEYGTKVNVLHRTELKFKVNEKGKILRGNWVEIEMRDDEGNKYPCYVFDGYLSKIKPKDIK